MSNERASIIASISTQSRGPAEERLEDRQRRCSREPGSSGPFERRRAGYFAATASWNGKHAEEQVDRRVVTRAQRLLDHRVRRLFHVLSPHVCTPSGSAASTSLRSARGPTNTLTSTILGAARLDCAVTRALSRRRSRVGKPASLQSIVHREHAVGDDRSCSPSGSAADRLSSSRGRLRMASGLPDSRTWSQESSPASSSSASAS